MLLARSAERTVNLARMTRPSPDSGHLQQARHPFQVVRRRFYRQAKFCPSQADAPDRLSSHLRQAGEDKFDPRSGAGDTSIARLVAFANRLPGLTFALDVGPPTDLLEPTLAGLVVIPPIGPEIAAPIVSIQYL